METNPNPEIIIVDEVVEPPVEEVEPVTVDPPPVDPPTPVEPPVDTSIKYSLVASEITYPLVDQVVGEEVIEGVVHLEQVLLENGEPDVEIILDDEGGPAIKKAKFISVPKTRKLVEAKPDLDGVPDGVLYEVLAWTGDNEAEAITLKFHIGRSAFEAVNPARRASVLVAEIENKYREARSNWQEGLELAPGSDAK